MFPRRMQAWARRLAEGIVAPLARVGIDPNVVTITGFLLNIVTAAVLATGHLSSGGALLLVSGLFDLLDGALARVEGSQSAFGAFLDSLLDRYSEATILLALIYVFTIRQRTADVLLVYAVAVGSLMISYARARAEGLGVEAKVGIAPRPERILILGAGLLFNPDTTVAALAILAFLTHVTALQRLYHVWRQTAGPDKPARQEPPARIGSKERRERRVNP
ncbi:MAG TPA: CDP-alcohol phosphatidyltransferase family protein [Chloroflexota bacterium]